MAHQQRAYAAVPQAPLPSPPNPGRKRPPTSVNSSGGNVLSRPNPTATGVAKGEIGAGYGPYAHHPQARAKDAQNNSRFTTTQSEVSRSSENPYANRQPQTTTVPPYLWDVKDPDLDDPLHNPDPSRDGSDWTIFSGRGWINAFTLFALVAGLVTLFAGYPIVSYYTRPNLVEPGFNIGGVNFTGQVPDLPNLPRLIDPTTPEEAMTYAATDGQVYELVFSDEFSVDGRSFYPGDDPYWEAVDFHYWPTGDKEWYDPSAITTKDGKLVITMTRVRNHGLNFMSGMLQSWNKFCFTGGYIEVAISLPGSPEIPGFWPGAWTMGNLGRPGYGATTEGLWPYSYDTCDLGTFPNQTDKNGNPAIALTSGDQNYGGSLSYLPGQRLSACTCPDSDHPGPVYSKGRSAPEIDILEAQIDTTLGMGEVSQSFQIAPYDAFYQFVNTTPAATIYDPATTKWNTYKGSIFQQAVSALTYLDSSTYELTQRNFGTYGFEYWPSRDTDGYITWFVDHRPTWTYTNAAAAPNPLSLVGQRLIAEEPMSIILNLGMSDNFQAGDPANLQFPATMLVDYVRVYQRPGAKNYGCSPPDFPTEDYINNHAEAYGNPNATTWAQAGFTFPRNSLYDGC